MAVRRKTSAAAAAAAAAAAVVDNFPCYHFTSFGVFALFCFVFVVSLSEGSE